MAGRESDARNGDRGVTAERRHPPVPRDVLAFAREMRNGPTKAEAKLWSFLRGKRLGGFKFRRQHPMGRHILDFYCPRARLAIELDGDEHDSDANRTRDARRDIALARLGVRTLRFWNTDVLTRTHGVLRCIWEALTRPSPGGRGKASFSHPGRGPR